MNDISIGINVDTRQLSAAKAEMLGVSAALRDLDKHAGVKVRMDGPQGEIGDITREMMSTMRRLENISLKVGATGGKKTAAQEQEAARLLERSRTAAKEYENVLGKIGQGLDALYEKRKRLEAVPWTSPKWAQAQEELNAVDKEYQGTVGRYEKIQSRYNSRFDRARSVTQQAAAEIAGAELTPGASGGMSIGKLLGGGAALLGGFSVLGFLNQARQEYRGMAGIESALTVRGIGFNRDQSPYGFSAMEEAETALALNRRTGARGMNLTRSAEKFARATGSDLSTGVGFLGDIYGYTGMSADKQGRLTDIVVALKENSKDKRIEEILKLINSNLGAAFTAQGNKALNESQITNIMATTMGLYNKAGAMGNSSELFNTLQGGLRMGAGDTAGELLKWSALGGFDGPMTASKMIDMQRKQDRGLVDPDLRDKTIAMISKTPGRANQNLMLQRVLFGGFSKPGGSYVADMILDLYGKEGMLTGINNPAKKAKIFGDYLKGAHVPPGMIGEVEKLMGVYLNTPGAGIQSRKAQADRVRLEAGDSLEKAFGKFEGIALNTADEVLSSNLVGKAINAVDKGGAALITSWKGFHADPLIRDVAKKTGLDVELLRAVVANESAFDPKAVSRKGAKGLMQLMPETARDLGVRNPFDPRENLTGGAKHLKRLLSKYHDKDQALAAFNWGEGNVDRYGMGALPPETVGFVSHVKGTEEARRAEAPKESAPIVGTESGSFLGYVGLFQEILGALRVIAANTAPKHQPPRPLPGSEN